MKKFIIVIVALSYWTGAFSQTQKPWNDNMIPYILDRSPFIFEGVVIDTMYYNGVTGGFNLTQEYDSERKPLIPIKPLTAIKVQLIHVYRGDLNPGTIEMVDDIGGFWSNGIFMHIMIGERDRPIQPGTKAIFFCSKSTYKPSPMLTDNEIRVVPINGIGGGQGGDGSYYLFNKRFNTKEELYQFLSKYPNITIPKDTVKIEETPLKQTQAQKAEEDSIKRVQNKLLFEEKRKKNYEQYLEQRKKRKDAQQKEKQ